jgi:hypothetical protein
VFSDRLIVVKEERILHLVSGYRRLAVNNLKNNIQKMYYLYPVLPGVSMSAERKAPVDDFRGFFII